MIQFNLLPDIKKEYIKVRRTRRLIMTTSVVSSVVSIVIVGILFALVQGSQKNHIDNLSTDIQDEFNSLKAVEDLNKILTVQNQLGSLQELHENKPETSRLFEYLTQLTPTEVTVSTLNLSMINSTINMSGRADSLASINQFVDTLKFSTYTIEGQDGEPVKPFSAVITRLNRDNISATYTLDFVFDPVLFNNTLNVALDVPNIVSTRSNTNKPSQDGPAVDLFDETPEDLIIEGATE